MRAVSACGCRLQSVLMYLPAFIRPPLSVCSIVLLSVHLFFNATVWFLLRSPTVIQCADVGVSLVSCCLLALPTGLVASAVLLLSFSFLLFLISFQLFFNFSLSHFYYFSSIFSLCFPVSSDSRLSFPHSLRF